MYRIWNRSKVQGSTFRVKDKEGIKDPKSSLKMLIFPNNCQFGSKFWISPDEADAFLVNTDLIIYYENSSFFLDIIGRSEAFSENRFQVSGVRFQAGSHFFTTDT